MGSWVLIKDRMRAIFQSKLLGPYNVREISMFDTYSPDDARLSALFHCDRLVSARVARQLKLCYKLST